MRWPWRKKTLSHKTERFASMPRMASRKTLPWSTGIGRQEWLNDPGEFLQDYYCYVRNKVPIVSNGIGVWVDLSSTGRTLQLAGGSDNHQKGAAKVLDALDNRLYEFDFEHGSGIAKLCDLFFLSFYTNGRFCAELVPFADGRGVAYLALTNPFSIKFRRSPRTKRLEIFQRQGSGYVRLPKERIFYAALDPDEKNPYGISLLDSIPWVLEIKEQMMRDMAVSSHNAGIPRLHIRITPPEPLPGESPADYHARLNSHFDEAVTQFRDLNPEDNVFSWAHVEVDIVGRSGGAREQFSWSVNSERVTEEVIAGLHLFGWVLGYSFSTTKNWVNSQYDLLVSRVQRGQSQGKRFLEWIQNAELRMRGIPTRVEWSFEQVRDPGELVKQRALDWKFRRIDRMLQRGYIGPAQASRELGLQSPYDEDRVLESVPEGKR